MTGDPRMWLLVVVTFACLWCFWLALNWTFDLIERAHQRLREQAEADASLEAMHPNWERER